MSKIPYKVRVGVGVGLVLWSIVAIIATIIWAAYGAPLWVLIAYPIISAISFIAGIIFVPRTNENGTPFVLNKKSKVRKPKKYKPKNQKRPFITEEEWKEQEEEDDEMMFIEEVVEDD